jgi:hypothetical protein
MAAQMTGDDIIAPSSLVATLLALELGAFGWRINREITLGDQTRRTWIPVADLINIAALLAVTTLCIVAPLAIGVFGRVAKTALAVGFMLIALHPINIASHYRLFSRAGRTVYTSTGRDYPYLTRQEAISLAFSILAATAAGGWVWRMT